MKIMYDMDKNFGYIRFKAAPNNDTKKIKICKDAVIEMSGQGDVYGVDLLNAKQQLGDSITYENQSNHKLQELRL
ncbi:MAG: hypothetical protein SFW63_09090 [Alphaproteobacteria bacterium]|nr:hypothetical protein [Alphaproteobacteria bacterium]